MPGASILFAVCAAVYAAAAGAVVLPRLPGRSNVALAGACAVSAIWAATLAADPLPSLIGAAAALDFLRAGAWFGAILVLARGIAGPAGGWRAGTLLGLAFAFGTLLAAFIAWQSPGSEVEPSLVSLGIDARLGFAIGILLLVENLYRNAPEEARWHINLTCIAVGGTFLYEIMLYADTVLYRRVSPLLFAGQAPASLMVVPLLLIGARRQLRWKEDVGVSRSVVFHTATLLLGGIFLVGLAAAGEVFRRFGPGWGRLAEASLIFGGCIALAVLVTSGSARSQLRALVVDHFFSRRYDYQREWVRCIATLSAAGPYLALHKRVIRAVADIVDSPAGVLFLNEASFAAGSASFRAAGSWNAPALEGARVTSGHPLLVSLRAGGSVAVTTPGAPAWFPDMADAWLAVALPEASVPGGVPMGFIVLARPRASFRLEREVFDLLRIVGREVALFIAEQRATEALVEARQFAEAGRRFTFVAHDIKNVASGLSLLLANAEQHLENPEFRADLLATLRASIEKISALLGRLQGPAARAARPLLSPRQRLEVMAASLRGLGPTPVLLECEPGRTPEEIAVAMEEPAFDAAVRHLIDNAIEASPPGVPVRIRLRREAGSAIIEIRDSGRGMPEEFVREALFRPFESTKPAGFGLGAFQARALLGEAGGELTVSSAPGQGTTMRIVLPLAHCGAPAPLALSA
ncbi:MAG TPA: XrtA/PEP-CTERM system histidine kinase PrsK [Acetobacteraceae bacterium]|nr:XrtA/PEP-CTERM system histidine kinase PrsK [Acetobacteraceae bacterium]